MKKFAALLIVLGLLVAAVPVVFADADDPTGDITINGTAASVVTHAIVLEGHNLDGTDFGNANYLLGNLHKLTIAGYDDPDDTYDGYNQSWMVTDPRGTGAGWLINVYASDFTAVTGPGSLEVPAATIPLVGVDAHVGVPLFHMLLDDKVNDGGVMWIDGQCGDLVPVLGQCSEATATKIPVSSGDFALDYTALSEDDQEFVHAVPDSGMGSYYLNPEFRLFVPAETYAGTYRSTITVTLIAPMP